ncbi:MAG: YbjN domain-containing protein [Pseudomonadota bacterium]
MRITTAVMAAALAVAVAAPAGAQTFSRTNGDILAGMLSDLGYRAELTSDDRGDPLVHSSTGGVNFSIYFYGCSDNKDCTSIQYAAGFENDGNRDQAMMNNWNMTKRFGTAYVSDNGDVWLEYDINMDGGITRANMEDTLGLWEDVLGQFTSHIGFN